MTCTARIAILVTLAFLLTGCQSPTPILTARATPTRYTLTVLNGAGSGQYTAGSIVHVWANPYPPGWTFDTWRGDTEAVPDVRSMHALIIMPAENVMVRAAYKQIPVWSASHEEIAGRDIYYFFPPQGQGYKGVILFFHGSGGDAREWSDFGTERRHFLDDAIAEGYAIVALNSADRVNRQWNLAVPPASNTDLKAVEAVLAALRTRGQISTETPIYAVGMSRGGRFATLASYVLDMKATAIWVGAGHEDILKVTTVPTIWCLADQDPIIEQAEVVTQYARLLDKGVDALYSIHPPTPLYPLYFANIEGIDEAASQQLFSEFQAQGYLDAQNFLIENPRFSKWENYIGSQYSEAARLDIQDRLFVAYAEHAFYSDCDHRVLDFFDSHP